MPDKAFVRCEKCRAINSIPPEKLGQHPVCGRCKTPLGIPMEPITVTAANFETEVLKWPGVVLVEFWVETCSVCMSLMPTMRNLARQRAGKLRIALINVNNEVYLSNRFEVRSLPTFMIYRNGALLNRLNGALAQTMLEEWIDSSSSLSFRF